MRNAFDIRDNLVSDQRPDAQRRRLFEQQGGIDRGSLLEVIEERSHLFPIGGADYLLPTLAHANLQMSESRLKRKQGDHRGLFGRAPLFGMVQQRAE